MLLGTALNQLYCSIVYEMSTFTTFVTRIRIICPDPTQEIRHGYGYCFAEKMIIKIKIKTVEVDRMKLGTVQDSAESQPFFVRES